MSEAYYAVPCDVQWHNNDHSSCDKCLGTGRVPIVETQVNDHLLQWFMGSILVVVASLAILAVWAKR